MVEILKFGRNFKIWSKFYNLVEILKFGRNFKIWSKLWNLVEILKFGRNSEILENFGNFGKKIEIWKFFEIFDFFWNFRHFWKKKLAWKCNKNPNLGFFSFSMFFPKISNYSMKSRSQISTFPFTCLIYIPLIYMNILMHGYAHLTSNIL